MFEVALSGGINLVGWKPSYSTMNVIMRHFWQHAPLPLTPPTSDQQFVSQLVTHMQDRAGTKVKRAAGISKRSKKSANYH